MASSMGDISETDGEPQASPSRPTSRRVPSITGPVGEPGLPPSRPSTAATALSQTPRARSSQTPRRQPPTSNPNQTTAGGSPVRPSRSPASSSRTHVPMIQSHAFFRPMSSQRLQAQRGQRPASTVARGASSHGGSDVGSNNAKRMSSGSIETARATAGLQRDSFVPPLPPSRGTEYTIADPHDRTTANSTPTGFDTIRSRGESVTALNKSHETRLPPLTDSEKPYMGPPAPAPPQKSPRTFGSTFMPGRNSGTVRESAMRPQGHERLSSAESSPKRDPEIETSGSKASRKNIGKNYEYFPGNLVFCLGGRWQNTRDRPVNILTGVLVTVPAILFFASSAPWLWRNVSPALPIIFGYIFLLSMSSFIHASVTDPGVLPRNLHPFPTTQDEADPLALGPPTTEWTMVKSSSKTSVAMEVPTKYCKSCSIWRPPRAHHCRVCDNCVETQDHHCVWLNNCVGRRNYRYFFTFVSTASLLGVFLFGTSLAHLLLWRTSFKKETKTFGDAIDANRVVFALWLYALLATPYPASLWGYHLFLIGRGETTREYLNSHKFMKKDRHRPFTLGSITKNWVAVVFRPRPPTYIHFKKPYMEGDQRFSEIRGRKQRELARNAQTEFPTERSGPGLEMADIRRGQQEGGLGFQGPGHLQDRTPRL